MKIIRGAQAIAIDLILCISGLPHYWPPRTSVVAGRKGERLESFFTSERINRAAMGIALPGTFT